MPAASSSSSRRSSVVSSSTGCPKNERGCGSNVTTVGRSPAARAASITRRWPRCTPSNVPIATARRSGASSAEAPRDDHVPACHARRARPPRRAGATRSNASGDHGVRDAERPDLRSPQRAAVPAERARDRPHVGAGADAHVERDHVVCIRDDVERVDRRAPQGHLDLDAAPCEPVCALPADLHRGRRGDRQLDLAAEAREPALELRLARRLELLDDRALRIAGRGPRRQVDVGEIALVQADEAWGDLSCPSGQQQEQAGRERVECPRMTCPRTGHAADLRDDCEGRRTRGLVDQRDARGLKRSRGHAARRIPGGRAR